MLELARSSTPQEAGESWSHDGEAGLVAGLASTAEEIEQVQRLRYQVFSEEMGAVLHGCEDGLDRDRFDPWCEHLMVRELGSGRVVGTYRILTPQGARGAGGYYSESEFDLSGLGEIRQELVEFGRSCTHADFRSGSVIMLLWAGLSEFLVRGGFRYVLGCASVPLRDDGVTAAEVYRQAEAQIRGPGPKVAPWHRYPVERLNHSLPAKLPPLIKGYLKIGARVCGEPAWDPDFNTADFPMLLTVDEMDERYRKHFGLDALLAEGLPALGKQSGGQA
ncbi:GNAT family N-acetyltransferase [Kerstersia sp.]|uniref:GNAT family N-acetyltransferase n=1 Tax=Kerstersia sp. TaxID=1930783 RepID=UPI003F8EA517